LPATTVISAELPTPVPDLQRPIDPGNARKTRGTVQLLRVRFQFRPFRRARGPARVSQWGTKGPRFLKETAEFVWAVRLQHTNGLPVTTPAASPRPAVGARPTWAF